MATSTSTPATTRSTAPPRRRSQAFNITAMPVPPDVLRAVAAALRASAVEPVDDLTTSGRATVVRLHVAGGAVPTAILKLGGDHVAANRCGLAFLHAVLPGAGPLLLGAGA